MTTIVLHIINFELLAFRTWNFCTKESKATNIEISVLGWNKRDELSFLFCLAFFRLELSFLVPVFHLTYQYQSSSYILFLFEQGHWVWFNNYWLHHNPITALNPHCQELLHYVPKKENHKIVSQNRLPH